VCSQGARATRTNNPGAPGGQCLCPRADRGRSCTRSASIPCGYNRRCLWSATPRSMAVPAISVMLDKAMSPSRIGTQRCAFWRNDTRGSASSGLSAKIAKRYSTRKCASSIAASSPAKAPGVVLPSTLDSRPCSSRTRTSPRSSARDRNAMATRSSHSHSSVARVSGQRKKSSSV
jgi:hypothetical protein